MATTSPRTGEFVIQDTFQRDMEDGLSMGGKHQKVLLWNHGHDELRLNPLTHKPHPHVVMRSLDSTTDKSYGVNRHNIHVNLWGLVDALEEINSVSFQNWLNDYPQTPITVRGLAEISATKLAKLFEEDRHGERTHTWRMLLALGEKAAWDKIAGLFGCAGDPRVLTAKDIPGAPSNATPLHYRPCYTTNELQRPFLDVEPEWLEKAMGQMKGAVAQEAFARAEAVLRGSTPRNRHCWVREFPMGGVNREYADFALLINGLPIVLIEIKTPDAGIKKAVRDFQEKPTYQGTPLCVASDGKQVIMASAMSGSLEAWVHYAGNLASRIFSKSNTDPLDSRTYVTQELLSRPDRLEFFLLHAGSINEAGIYQVGRSQQYQALAHWGRDLAWTEVCNALLKAAGKPLISVGNRLIRQTQRTGKTHTMIRAMHLALGSYPELFRLSVVMVGEVLILGQIHEDLDTKDGGLADQSLVVQRVETRAQLTHILDRERTQAGRSEGRILLANMQKISARDTQALALPDSQRTLVVVDEGHLAQTGTTADVRDLIFPQASHLLLTATPKSGMAKRYGISEGFHVLDDFGYGLAQKAGMVCPVLYKRHPYSFLDDPHKIAELTLAINKSLGGDVNQRDVAAAMTQVMQGDLDDLDDDNGRNASRARAVARALRNHLEQEFIQERLDAIVDLLVSYRDSLEKDAAGNSIFRPRALAFARNTESAIGFIEAIWELNGSNKSGGQKSNVYRGFRFGVDVADFGKEVDDNGNDKDKARKLATFNPGIATDRTLKKRMKNLDPDVAVDVLIAVGKYTKGYNNDQLVATVLLRNVGEPSLMNQIYTRPATAREGKPKGVCLDLAFGLANAACWQASLSLYDRQFDLDHLYTQDKVDALVTKVGTSLDKTAAVLGLTTQDLADYSQVVAAFETMGETQRKISGRQFILKARNTATLIAKMPDSSIYGGLRAPLVGLKVALTKLQSLYPDLVESIDVDADGSLDGGYTDQSLGILIRDALETLSQSSLKSLLEIRMGDAFEILPTQREDALLVARERQALRATQSALQSIMGAARPIPAIDNTGEPGTRTRAMRSESALTDSLNRILDKLRDDCAQEDLEHKPYADKLAEALQVMQAWESHMATQGGDLKYLLLQHLDSLLFQRSQLLSLDQVDMGVVEDLKVILDEAARDMAEEFTLWHQGLSADWTERPAKQLAGAWKGQYKHKNLSDFLVAASQRKDLHGMLPTDWTRQLIRKGQGPNLKTLLGDGRNDVPIQDLPDLLEYSMQLALADRAAIRTARQWNEALAADKEGMAC